LVSHELRTPLASIIGYVEMLKDAGTSGPDADHCAEVIERGAQRLLRLVGDLLFLSQIQSGKMAMEFRSADLADIAAARWKRCGPRLSASTSTWPSPPPPFPASPSTRHASPSYSATSSPMP
jgi:signal transduction histidine kinase